MCHQTPLSFYGSFPQGSVPSRVLRPSWNKAIPLSGTQDPRPHARSQIPQKKRHYFCPRNSTLSYGYPISAVIQLNCPPPSLCPRRSPARPHMVEISLADQSRLQARCSSFWSTAREGRDFRLLRFASVGACATKHQRLWACAVTIATFQVELSGRKCLEGGFEASEDHNRVSAREENKQDLAKIIFTSNRLAGRRTTRPRFQIPADIFLEGMASDKPIGFFV